MSGALPPRIVPGSRIGSLGGGQLGRMLAMAAARLNFRTVVLEPQVDCPAAQVANDQIVAAYDDEGGLAQLAAVSDIITYEFENVPVAAAERLSAQRPVFPPAKALEVAQDRLVEKRFINDCGIATARFHAVDSQADLEAALVARIVPLGSRIMPDSDSAEVLWQYHQWRCEYSPRTPKQGVFRLYDADVRVIEAVCSPETAIGDFSRSCRALVETAETGRDDTV